MPRPDEAFALTAAPDAIYLFALRGREVHFQRLDPKADARTRGCSRR